jgi:hypothetical protein
MYQVLKNRFPFGHRHTFWGEVKRQGLSYQGLASRLPFVRKHTIWDEIDVARSLTFIGGVGIGMGLMFLFDPERGSHRRAMIRDAVVHSLHKTGDAIGVISRVSQVEDVERMGDRVDLH